jgi:hypothetical protein
VVASPKSRLWWVLWICVCLWFIYAPKVRQLCTNQLVVWFVWFVWIIDPLCIHPSPHLEATTCPSTPEVLQAKERIPIPFFLLFSLGDLHLSLSRNVGVHHERKVFFALNILFVIMGFSIVPQLTSIFYITLLFVKCFHFTKLIFALL